MLTILPRDEFKELLKNPIMEDNSYQFSYDEMKSKYSSSYDSILKYVGGSNCKFVGEGSSRIAYFIPAGSIEIDKTAPCCFKVAKNQKGIAQNRAEYNIFKKYGKLKCFPIVYDYDSTYDHFILTELGSELKDNESEVIYLTMFFKTIKNSSNCPQYLLNILRKINRFSDMSDALYYLAMPFIDDLYECIDDIPANEIIRDIKNAFNAKPTFLKRYETLISFIEFALNGGTDDVEFVDFTSCDNWAFVCRQGEMQLIPIDFGYTSEIVKTMYRH